MPVDALALWAYILELYAAYPGFFQGAGAVVFVIGVYFSVIEIAARVAVIQQKPKAPMASRPMKPCPDCGDQVAMSAYDGQPTPDGVPGYVFRCACGHRFDAWDYRTHVTSEKAIRKWNHHSSTYAKGAAIEKAGLSAWSKKPPANQLKSR